MLPTKSNSEIIKKTIDRFCDQHVFDDNSVVIFGCTLYAGNIIECLNNKEIEVTAFIDNDTSKVRNYCSGIKVYEPEWIATADRVVVIIASPTYGREMKGQLLGLGFAKEKILEIPVENPSLAQAFTIEERYEKKLCEVKKGLKTYSELMTEDIDVLVVFPYPGTGDIYMACGFLKLYLEKMGYEEPLLVVSKSSCEKVARLFDYNNIVVISQSDIDNLLLIWQFLGSEVIKVKPALFWGWNTKYYFRAYRKMKTISFIDYFKYDVFDLDKKDMFQHPSGKDNAKEVSSLFAKYDLVEGKTVIIAPYAGSFISSISIDTWENAVKILKDKGYTVCTNCVGEEKTLHGTIRLEFDYRIAVEVLERAGGFIAVRSGLCDVVSSANAKMLVVYESNYLASDIEYFGIKKMGLNDKITEIDYCEQDSFLRTIDGMY